MKSLFPAAAIALLATSFAACNKDDDGGTTPPPTTPPPAAVNKTWKLGTTTYTANNYVRASETFQVRDADGNGLHFTFGTYPTTEGTYNVVGRSATLGAADVSILAFGPNAGTSYFSTGNDNVKVAVKVISASTLGITLPETWVLKPGADSLKLSANLGDL